MDLKRYILWNSMEFKILKILEKEKGRRSFNPRGEEV